MDCQTVSPANSRFSRRLPVKVEAPDRKWNPDHDRGGHIAQSTKSFSPIQDPWNPKQRRHDAKLEKCIDVKMPVGEIQSSRRRQYSERQPESVRGKGPEPRIGMDPDQAVEDQMGEGRR